MKVLLSAAEASSDVHGAQLLQALRREAGEVSAFGVGGPRLQEAGLQTVVDARDLLSMGFGEVVARLPRILEALREVGEAAERERPDVAVVIDYPDFHFRLARRLRKLGIPVVYYIPPKVWAWRRGRAARMRDLFSRVLCILPFEEAFFRSNGVEAKYVGNPLMDELPLKLGRAGAREQLGIDAGAKALALMPGSRPSEIKHHLGLMLDAATLAAAKLRSSGALGASERLVVLMPFAATAEMDEIERQVAAWKRGIGGASPEFILDARVSQGDAAQCLIAADAALVKSGTSTLEAGLLGCPHAVVYRPNAVSSFLFRHLVRYRGPVGLVNLVASEAAWAARPPYLVREILSEQATPRALAEEAVALLTDEARRASLTQGFAGLRARIEAVSESPSRVAAREILAECERARGRRG